MRRRSFEEHVLEEMTHAGRSGDLVPAADVIPDPERNDGRVLRFERMDHEPVVEAARQRDVYVGDGKSLSVERLAARPGPGGVGILRAWTCCTCCSCWWFSWRSSSCQRRCGAATSSDATEPPRT